MGSNTALPLLVLKRKLSYSIKYVVYEIRSKMYSCILSLIKRTLAKDRTLLPYRKNDFNPPTKRFKGLQQRTRKSLLPNVKRFNYELVVFLCCKPSANFLYLTFVTKFEPLCRLFSSAVSVCDPLNISVVEENCFPVR